MADAVPRFERKTAFRMFNNGFNQDVAGGANATVDFNGVLFDLGSNVNLTTNAYIVPNDGIYIFNAGVSFSAQSTAVSRILLALQSNGVEMSRGDDFTNRTLTAGDFNSMVLTAIVHLPMGASVTLLMANVVGPTARIAGDSSGRTVFLSGYRIQSESRTILGG